MNRILITLAALAFLALPGATSAQDPYADYNRARAYAHYANSLAPVKTFSSLDAARVTGYDTPFESVRYYQSPGYYREETSVRYGRSYFSDPGTVSGVIVPRYLNLGEPGLGYYDPSPVYPGVLSADTHFGAYPRSPAVLTPNYGYGTRPVLSTGPAMYPQSYYPYR